MATQQDAQYEALSQQVQLLILLVIPLLIHLVMQVLLALLLHLCISLVVHTEAMNLPAFLCKELDMLPMRCQLRGVMHDENALQLLHSMSLQTGPACRLCENTEHAHGSLNLCSVLACMVVCCTFSPAQHAVLANAQRHMSHQHCHGARRWKTCPQQSFSSSYKHAVSTTRA